MAGHQGWFRATLAVVVACLGCAGAPVIIPNLPPLSDVNAVRNTVLQSLQEMRDTVDWELFLGDRQRLSDTLSSLGTIRPHRAAHVHGLQHGKVLARIDVDSAAFPQLGLQVGANYWILANRPDRFPVPDGAHQSFVNVFIPERGDSIRILPLYINQHGYYQHKQAAARWIVGSDALPWASCGAHMCCCGGSGCDAM